MSKTLYTLSFLVLTSALTACGGGSSNSSGSTQTATTGNINSGTTTGNNNSGTNTGAIKTQCAQIGTKVTVTSTGCVTSGTSPQSVICITQGPPQTIKMLSGNNITVTQLRNSGTTFTTNSLNIGNLEYVCG